MIEGKRGPQERRDANGLDLLRVYAAFVVVMLHVAAQGFYVIQPYWKTAVVYNAVGRVAVPLFFMISGAVMLPREESLRETGRRIFRRILCPYVAWSVIYSLYSGSLSDGGIVWSNIFLQAPFFHLPFMFQLLMLYLALPLLRGFWNNPDVNNEKRQYVIGSSLLGGVLCEFIPIVTGKAVLGFQLSCLPYYAGLAMLGAYIYERRGHHAGAGKSKLCSHIYIYIYIYDLLRSYGVSGIFKNFFGWNTVGGVLRVSVPCHDAWGGQPLCICQQMEAAGGEP